MEATGSVPDITTAPSWSDDPEYAWRDHWMQAIYFPRRPVSFKRGDSMSIVFSHDELSLWFDFEQNMSSTLRNFVERPICDCGLHYSWSRNRIAHLNSTNYAALTTHITGLIRSKLPTSSFLIDLITIADCSILPLLVVELAERMGINVRVCHIETSAYSRRFLQSICEADDTASGTILQLFDSPDGLAAYYLNGATCLPDMAFLVGEPYIAAGSLPWRPLLFYYVRRKLFSDTNLRPILLCPTRMRIWGVLVDFQNLWKVRAPVGTWDVFDLGAFDGLIQSAISTADALVEPQPLWEYPALSRSNPVCLFDIDFSQSDCMPLITLNQGSLRTETLKFNGIAFWAEWLFPSDPSNDGGNIWFAPSGPTHPILLNEKIDWDHSGPPQGVLLAPWKNRPVDIGSSSSFCVQVNVEFDPDTGDVAFSVSGI